jgi:itaconyl-CoA hydratase
MPARVSTLTGKGNFFEDFEVGDRLRHARGTTIGEIENQMLTKLVLNTADGHYNEHRMEGTPFGRRLVFGLVTGSVCIGLAMQDTGENALAELAMTEIKFTSPVFHGDTLYAYSEVLEKRDADRDDAGIVRFKHWGTKQDGKIVFEGERTVLVKRRSHWVDR